MISAETAGSKDAQDASSARRLVHDLRNEINVIGFACSALRQQVKAPGPDVLRSLDRIEAAYGRCAELLVAHGKQREASKPEG